MNALIMTVKSDVVGEIMNVGTGRPKSVNQIASILGGSTVHIPKRPGEPDCTQADITKIQKLIGWAPKVGFENGVNRMLGQIELWRDAPVWTEDTIEQATKVWFQYLGKPDRDN